jgi:hypothetical protein
MKKAKAAAAGAPCPVLLIALCVGELWDAHAGAEEREGRDGDSTAADQINRFRAAVEETASFERALSPAGALFQLALAQQTAVDLFARIPDGDKFTDPAYHKLLRLLDSAALVLRDVCAIEDYQAVKDVVGVYIGIDWSDFAPPCQWREDIVELADEYRHNHPGRRSKSA